MEKQNDGCLGCATLLLSIPIMGMGCLALLILIGLFFELMKWIFTSIF
ncbi:ORF133 [Staphylococcus phage 37]|uniref:ORF133 n=1 Tax=Staphylococcus phage 37 TaxID=2936813 RepID=Q4ZCB5_9CAUD|nr:MULTISPECIES: hypothetical protein [Staphylococcus]YP_240111.1 ORF133 [Staphylococcus phage 37]AAX91336.1 ORF133 [Staphylococcus phage 37]EKS26040.1 hypothetical protein HMPREF9310_01271 [Staphylococcus simulans ACS-120-V-Sch1]MDQ7113947.1 hypothetical protein [Staphylococcus simulans]UXR31869.1 hypothetical protein MUA81_08150 [Staphylococcus simulans]